jgi:hypothetical protein
VTDNVPDPINESEGADKTMLVIPGMTRRSSVPVFPSLTADIVASPGATPVMSPDVAFTVATLGALVLHDTGRPVNTLLLADRSVVVAWTVPPAKIESTGATAVTVATGSRTRIATASLFPSLR